MSQKKNKVTITWHDDQTEMLEEIAREYEQAMLMNHILPTTRKSPTATEQPNASGIIRFLMLKETGRLKQQK